MEKITKMSRAIMPSMTNQRGVLFGGTLLEWMDEVSGITAKRFAQSEVATTAYVALDNNGRPRKVDRKP